MKQRRPRPGVRRGCDESHAQQPQTCAYRLWRGRVRLQQRRGLGVAALGSNSVRAGLEGRLPRRWQRANILSSSCCGSGRQQRAASGGNRAGGMGRRAAAGHAFAREPEAGAAADREPRLRAPHPAAQDGASWALGPQENQVSCLSGMPYEATGTCRPGTSQAQHPEHIVRMASPPTSAVLLFSQLAPGAAG